MRVKRFNEELFGIGEDNKNKRLIDNIGESIFDNKDKIKRNDNIMSFSIKIPDGQIELTSPMEIIKAKDLSLKVDGKEIELSMSEKNRLHTGMKNYLPGSSNSEERSRILAMEGAFYVKTFEDYSMTKISFK